MHKYSLPFIATVLSIAACSGTTTSSRGQEITCVVDPGTGIIGRCEPGDGSGSGSNICHDIDQDGDDDPHDVADGSGDDHGGGGEHLVAPDNGDDNSGDSDGDGIPDDQDCDNHHGEDNDTHDELPYDVRPALGSTARPIQDAFAAKGGSQPAEIVSITMEGDTWHLAELQAGTPFLVTEDDCNHPGNRDAGRDRVIVTWRDVAGGPTQSDHLDIRYCKN